MTIEINLYENPSNTNLPCYFEQGGQESKAYLYLDIEGEGEMWIGSKYPSDKSWGHREHHRIQYRYSIPNNLTEAGYNDLMQDPRVLALAQRVVAGAEIEWDGSNYCGVLNDDAEAAEEDLSQYLEQVTAADAAERLRVEALKRRAHLSVVDIEQELDWKKEREEEDQEESV